jgi:2-keto-myo-inositol isomerase
VISADPGLPAIIARSEEFGYDGWYAIEMFNAELWQTPVAEAARLLPESAAALPIARQGERG